MLSPAAVVGVVTGADAEQTALVVASVDRRTSAAKQLVATEAGWILAPFFMPYLLGWWPAASYSPSAC